MEQTPLELLIPCFNPPKGWVEQFIDGYERSVEQLGFKPAVILVNDGSPNGIPSAQIEQISLTIPQFKYIEYSQNRGKGFALREAASCAQADFCIYTDVDFPYTSECLAKVWNSLQSGTNIAAGIKDNSYYERVPPLRRFISRILRYMIRKLLRMPISDTQCGLKGFDQKGKNLFLQCGIERYLFDLEFLFLASRDASVRMQAVPIALREGVVFSPVRLKVLLTETRNFFLVFLKST